MVKRTAFKSVLFFFLTLGVLWTPGVAVQAKNSDSSVTPTASPQPAKKSTRGRNQKRQTQPASSPNRKKANRPVLFLANAKGKAYLIHKGKRKKVHPPQKVEAKDRIVTDKNGKAYLEFQRGGTIEVGPKSDVKISELNMTPKTFRARFQLAFGKMKTAVHKLTTSTSLFEIEAGGVVTGVRGTVFEVDYDKDKNQEATKTFEGTVYAKVNGKEQLIENGHAMEVDASGVPAMETITAEDSKDFQEFVSVSNGLDDKKETLLEEVEKDEENNQSGTSENENGSQGTEKNAGENKDDESDKNGMDENKTPRDKEGVEGDKGDESEMVARKGQENGDNETAEKKEKIEKADEDPEEE